jgi:hypothetical protein
MLSGGLNMSELAKIEKKLKTHKPYVPVHEDPKAELRRLVQEHRNTTRNSVSLGLMASDRTDRKTGEVMPWSMAQIRQVLVSAWINRFSRIFLPVIADIVCASQVR